MGSRRGRPPALLRVAALATWVTWAATAAYADPAQAPPAKAKQGAEVVTIDAVVITAAKDPGDPADSTLGASTSEGAGLAARRNGTSDSAQLLRDLPGVSLTGAGGLSSLPAIHGLADDRLRTQVDGVDLQSACPNHMNSALSYIDPAKVAEVKVYSGITPVSVGGDSLGGTIQVKSAPPGFARPGEGVLVKGRAGALYRSNGSGVGYNLDLTLAGRWASLSYGQSSSQSDDVRAGRSFKPATPGREGGPPIPGDVVGSTAYRGATNRDLGLALRLDDHLLQLNLGTQEVGSEGFPNQRMDMTANANRLLSLRYTGQYSWGDLEARAYDQYTTHGMDMGPDRFSYGTGMPMDTKARNRGGTLLATLFPNDRDTLRAGAEVQAYTLYDWWPPVGGSMGPNTFWNVDYGRRDKLDAFAEWEARWSPIWLTQLGLRSDTIWTSAAAVQGYDNGLAGLWGNDAAAFNGRDRDRTDHNWDLSLLARYQPDATRTFEAGYARKVHSPNLYQRYAWSTNGMAALMNNFVGDGNGYIGDVDLRPETAHTWSLSGDWRSGGDAPWQLRATGYVTLLQDFIDARRCEASQCNAASRTATTGFLLLQYANQSARLYGFDLSSRTSPLRLGAYGTLTGTALLGYVRGENRTTGDNLYNIMPLNGKLALHHDLGGWAGALELAGVADKHQVSRVRNEIPTGAYALVHLRGSYEWRFGRIDLAVENLFNRLYAEPLGGAYVGQGASMTTAGIPWGVAVPGKGRSINVAMSLRWDNAR